MNKLVLQVDTGALAAEIVAQLDLHGVLLDDNRMLISMLVERCIVQGVYLEEEEEVIMGG